MGESRNRSIVDAQTISSFVGSFVGLGMAASIDMLKAHVCIQQDEVGRLGCPARFEAQLNSKVVNAREQFQAYLENSRTDQDAETDLYKESKPTSTIRASSTTNLWTSQGITAFCYYIAMLLWLAVAKDGERLTIGPKKWILLEIGPQWMNRNVHKDAYRESVGVAHCGDRCLSLEALGDSGYRHSLCERKPYEYL